MSFEALVLFTEKKIFSYVRDVYEAINNSNNFYEDPADFTKTTIEGEAVPLISMEGLQKLLRDKHPNMTPKQEGWLTEWAAHFMTLDMTSEYIDSVISMYVEDSFPDSEQLQTEEEIQRQIQILQGRLEHVQRAQELQEANKSLESVAINMHAQAEVGKTILATTDTKNATWLGTNVFIDPITNRGISAYHANVLMMYFGMQRRVAGKWTLYAALNDRDYWIPRRTLKTHTDSSKGSFSVDWGEWTAEGEALIRKAFATYIVEHGQIQDIDTLYTMTREELKGQRQRLYIADVFDKRKVKEAIEPTEEALKVLMSPIDAFEVGCEVLIPADNRRKEGYRSACTAHVISKDNDKRSLGVEFNGHTFFIKAKRVRKLDVSLETVEDAHTTDESSV
jgi:hypothetical protein